MLDIHLLTTTTAIFRCHCHLTNTETRALCKILGACSFDEKEEEMAQLYSLKRWMEELGHILTDATSLKYLNELLSILSEINTDDEEKEDDELAEALSPKSGGVLSEDEDEDKEDGEEKTVEPEEEEEEDTAGKGLNLSEEFLNSLDDLKISSSDDELGMGKENSRRKKRSSKGRDSAGSAASRRASRQRRLADVN